MLGQLSIVWGCSQLVGAVVDFGVVVNRLGRLPIVWGWLVAALGIVAMGVYDPNAVMPMLEGYIALLAIVGTLATLIVTSMLELWKSEQTQEISTMEERIAHRHRMEEMEMAHAHRLAEIEATGKYSLPIQKNTLEEDLKITKKE